MSLKPFFWRWKIQDFAISILAVNNILIRIWYIDNLSLRWCHLFTVELICYILAQKCILCAFWKRWTHLSRYLLELWHS